MSVSPCKYCFIHTALCHSQCEFHDTWKEEENRKKKMIRDKKRSGNMYRSYKRDACEKQRRRH